MRKFLLPLGVAALVLSGCASEATDAAADIKPENQATVTPVAPTEAPVDAIGPGSYTFESLDGAVGTLEVPGVAPADIEELRTISGAEPVTYLTGNLDNRQGSEFFDVYTISVYDPEGNKYTYEPAEDYVGTIFPEYDSDLYEQYQDVQGRYNVVADALERIDFVMVGPELPSQIVGVSVFNGFEDFGAQPAG